MSWFFVSVLTIRNEKKNAPGAAAWTNVKDEHVSPCFSQWQIFSYLLKVIVRKLALEPSSSHLHRSRSQSWRMLFCSLYEYVIQGAVRRVGTTANLGSSHACNYRGCRQIEGVNATVLKTYLDVVFEWREAILDLYLVNQQQINVAIRHTFCHMAQCVNQFPTVGYLGFLIIGAKLETCPTQWNDKKRYNS